jgi:hypothetical protein
MPRRPCPPPDGPFAVPVAGDLVMETGLVTASSTDGHPERDRNLTDVPQHVRQRFLQQHGGFAEVLRLQAPRGPYMITATPARQINAPITSYRSGR